MRRAAGHEQVHRHAQPRCDPPWQTGLWAKAPPEMAPYTAPSAGEMSTGFRRSALGEWVDRVPSARFRTLVARRLEDILGRRWRPSMSS